METAPALQVRRVRPSEYAAAGELTARAYLDDGFGSAGYEPALRDVAARAASAEVLVAVRAGDVVGAVTLAPGGSRWAERAAVGEAEIRMLAVRTSARGRGVGEALVRGCIELARAQGCPVLRLSTEPTMTTAHRLYARLGFRRTPEHDWEVEQVPGLVLLGYALDLV